MSSQHGYDPFFERLCQDILSLPEKGLKLFLYPHINADGDALGSALAFAYLAEQLGVEALILTEENLSRKLAFLPGAKRFIRPTFNEQALIEAYAGQQGLGLVIDSPGGERIGRRLALYESAAIRYVLDHHIPTAKVNENTLVDVSLAASCELITALVLFAERCYGREFLNEAMAINLFCGLMTDTGRFTYSNTSAQTLRMAAELLRFRLDIRALSLRLFDEVSKAKLALTGYVDTHAQYFYEDHMILSLIPYAFFHELQADEGDVEGLVSLLRDVEGVHLALLLRESAHGKFKVSVRSGEACDSQALALKFKGGGHLHAAGFTLESMSAEEAIRLCVEAAKEQFYL